jgi:SAM-dependent methyltransferase
LAVDWEQWQQSWDVQQAAYLPDREERFTALLDVVEAQAGSKPYVLDLACGTGSISRRLLRRLPGARTVALDLDPALLRIAAGTFEGDDRVTIVRADLSAPGWQDAIRAQAGDQPFDAVLTATALHWLPADRLAVLYSEVRELLRPGGVFCNADHLADDGLPELSVRLDAFQKSYRERLYAVGEALTWEGWWDAARQDPALADAVAERDLIFGGPRHGDSFPLASGHLAFLQAAGYSEVGLVWRGLTDAAFAAVR